MGLRAHLRDLDTGDGATRWMCSQPKGADTHEHDAWLQRSGREIADYLLTARPSWVGSGRWRERSGFDAAVLDRLAVDAVLPWSHVDVGMQRGRAEAAWARYQRRANM